MIWKGKKITLRPGQVIIGLREYAELWDIAKSTVKYWLDYLASSERITYRTSNKGTIVTILNWDKYQGDDQIVERQSNESRTRVERHPTLSEEGKKEEVINVFSDGNTSVPWEAFEKIYARFPKRTNQLKKMGMEKCRVQIRSPEKLTQLAQAVENYRKYVESEKAKDPKWSFQKTWGHFMTKNYWQDWIEVEQSPNSDYWGRFA